MVVAVFATVSFAGAQTTPVKSSPAEKAGTQTAKPKHVYQTTCPIEGGKINKKFYVDFEGKRIYVCCEQCLGTIKADPKKYITELEGKGITLYKTPKKTAGKGTGAAAGAGTAPKTAK
jgi:YHS domain-containing protein